MKEKKFYATLTREGVTEDVSQYINDGCLDLRSINSIGCEITTNCLNVLYKQCGGSVSIWQNDSYTHAECNESLSLFYLNKSRLEEERETVVTFDLSGDSCKDYL